MAPRERVTISASPPAYPGSSYGTIEVHHHHMLRTRRRSTTRAVLVAVFLLLNTVAFSTVCFVAWNYYNLSECEKNRLPWEKPCRDWLGKDAFFRRTH